MQHELQYKITRQLKKELIRRGLTMKQMASYIGLSPGQLSKVLSCGSDMRAEKWHKACQFVGWEYDEEACLAIIPSARPQPEPTPEPAPEPPFAEPLPLSPADTDTHDDHNNLKEDIPMPSNDSLAPTISISIAEAQLFLSMIRNRITSDLSSGTGSCTFEQLRILFGLYERLDKEVPC